MNFATATTAELKAAGFTVKTIRGQKGPKSSLWGVKGRHSGKNRKGQVAAPVGKMNTNEVAEVGMMTSR